MDIRRYEIYRARISLRHCEDQRPWIVIDEPTPGPSDSTIAMVVVAPLSSQLDLMNPEEDFLIARDDPNFSATGLRRTSYVIGNPAVRVPVARLERKLGCLAGDLLGHFRTWSGD